MMRVRKLEQGGDIATSGVIWLYDKEAVAQTIGTRIKLFLGEYFRDIQEGTPWFQSILGKNESLATVESILKNRIAQTEGVQRLLEFSTSFTPETRIYTVNCQVLTEWGALQIELNEGLISG